MVQVVAIDVGSGYVKWRGSAGAAGKMVAAAALENRRDQLGALGAGRLVVELASGERWVVGEDALAAGERGIDTLSDQYAGGSGWMALLYAALVEAGVQSGERVQCAVGLPQALYSEGKAALAKMVGGAHRFQVGGQQVEVALEARVLPQAAAVILGMPEGNEDDENVGVIDVGTYTTGWAGIREGRLQTPLCGGEKMGVSNIAKDLGELLMAKYGIDERMERLHKVLISKQIKHLGEQVELGDEIEKLTTPYAHRLVARLERAWPAANSMAIVLAGGGAALFEAPLRERWRHLVVAENPQEAVVNGLWEFAAIKAGK